jgi:hypothetical protein
VTRFHLSAARSAWLLAVVVGVVVITITQIPYLQAARAERRHHYPGKYFTGAFTTSAEDTATYWGWMEQASEGHFFFEDHYTPERSPRNYANPFLWLLGTAARVSGAPVPLVYAASRPVLGVLVLVFLWRVLGLMFVKPWERFAAYLLAVLPGGFEGVACYLERNHGWTHVTSPGWWIAEMNTFFSLMVFPHFLAGFVLMLATAWCFIRAWTGKELWLRYAIASGIALTVLTFVHPYDTVTMLGMAWSAPIAFGLAERELPRRAASVTVVATAVWLPSFIYNWIVFRSNPAMRGWDLQNLMETPEAGRLAIAFGVTGILAAAALFGLKKMTRPQLAMAAWLVSTLIMIQLPFRFQRRMLGGIQFPMAVMAVFAVSTLILPALLRAVRRSARPADAGGAVLACVLLFAPLQWLTPYYILDIEQTGVRRVVYPAWIGRPESDILRYLRERTPRSATVLSSYEMGNYVPALANRRCVLGHYALTIDAAAKQKEVAAFYSNGRIDDAWRLDLLRRYDVGFVLWTPHERALGAWDPKQAPWLREVFRAGNGADVAAIYELNAASPPH